MHYVSQSSPFYWQGVVQLPGVNNVDGFKALEEQSPRTTIQVLTTNSSHCLHVPPTHYKLSQYTLQTWSHLRSTYWHTAKLILIPKPEQLPLPPPPKLWKTSAGADHALYSRRHQVISRISLNRHLHSQPQYMRHTTYANNFWHQWATTWVVGVVRLVSTVDSKTERLRIVLTGSNT